MRYILILLAAMFIASCGSSIVTSDELVLINTGLSLDKAKVLFEPYFDDEEDIVKTNVNGKDYTIIILKRITSTEKESYQIDNGPTYDTHYDGTRSYSGTRTETRTQNNYKYTNFYLMFEEQNYLFSGYGYEAKISHKSPMLLKLIDFTLNEEEEE